MGLADTVTKAYMKDNSVFADAFNYLIYGGEAVVDPKQLQELDTTEIALPFGSQDEDGKQPEEAVQKYRDVLKSAIIKQDDEAAYILLGIENQTDIHYAMPVRNIIYDALQYGKQVADIAAKHRASDGDAKGHSRGEYLSGFYKEDKITPVITLVLHFGANEWDGPLSLHEMMAVKNKNLLNFVQDYQIHLIDPAKLSAEDLERFSSSLREVIGYIKYSKDKKRLSEFLTDNPRMLIEANAARVIKAVTNTPLDIPEGAEVIDVCKAVEEMMNESEERGELRMLVKHNMGTPDEFLESGLGRYLGMVGTNIIYLWLIGLMHRIINKKIRELPIKYWILIIVIPIISIFLLQTMLDGFVGSNTYSYVSLGVSLAGIIFINLAMFNFFESFEDKIKLKYLETIKQQEQENYKLLTLSYKQVREFKHDIENQFLVLNDMLENNDTDSAKEYLVKLSSFVRLANRLCYTGNNAVDSIVNIKGSLAQTYGIEFICKVNIITNIKADELELCRIIGNALDNAIEGCQRAGVSHKHIWISLMEEREKLFIVITNTSDKVDTSVLTSTKKEQGLHGIGINSIKSSVDRLGGLVSFDYDDGIFKLNIMVRNCLQI